MDKSSSLEQLSQTELSHKEILSDLNFFWTTICFEEDLLRTPELHALDFEESYNPSFKMQTKDSYIWHCAYEARNGREFYIRPQLYVAYDTPEINKPESKKVVSVEVRGSIEDLRIMTAIGRLISLFNTSLFILKLIDCNLGAKYIRVLARALKTEDCIEYLYLDYNSRNVYQNYYELLNNDRLKLLSLKYCEIDDTGVQFIADKLQWKDTPQQLLLTLDLTGNNITCRGASFLAEALRWNRSLQRLILTGNKIRNKGAIQFATIIQPFQLDNQESKLRQSRFWKRQKIVNLYVSDNVKKIMKKTLQYWSSGQNDDAVNYSRHHKKMIHNSIVTEMSDLFGQKIVNVMEKRYRTRRKKYDYELEKIDRVLNETERSELLAASETDSKFEWQARNDLLGMISTKPNSPVKATIIPSHSFSDRMAGSQAAPAKSKIKQETKIVTKNKSFRIEDIVKLTETDHRNVKKLVADEESAFEEEVEEEELSTEEEEEEQVICQIDNYLGNFGSDQDSCHVTSISTESSTSTKSTWSSFGIFPNQIYVESDYEDLTDEQFIKVYGDVRRLVEHIHTPKFGKGELFDNEMCMIYNEMYSEAEKCIPPDPHPMSLEVHESQVDDTIWCYGNYSLTHLNLSYNRIGKKGLQAFLEALQLRRRCEHVKRNLTFVFKGNCLKQKNRIYKELEALSGEWPPEKKLTAEKKKGRSSSKA